MAEPPETLEEKLLAPSEKQQFIDNLRAKDGCGYYDRLNVGYGPERRENVRILASDIFHQKHPHGGVGSHDEEIANWVLAEEKLIPGAPTILVAGGMSFLCTLITEVLGNRYNIEFEFDEKAWFDKARQGNYSLIVAHETFINAIGQKGIEHITKGRGIPMVAAARRDFSTAEKAAKATNKAFEMGKMGIVECIDSAISPNDLAQAYLPIDFIDDVLKRTSIAQREKQVETKPSFWMRIYNLFAGNASELKVTTSEIDMLLRNKEVMLNVALDFYQRGQFSESEHLLEVIFTDGPDSAQVCQYFATRTTNTVFSFQPIGGPPDRCLLIKRYNDTERARIELEAYQDYARRAEQKQKAEELRRYLQSQHSSQEISEKCKALGISRIEAEILQRLPEDRLPQLFGCADGKPPKQALNRFLIMIQAGAGKNEKENTTYANLLPVLRSIDDRHNAGGNFYKTAVSEIEFEINRSVAAFHSFPPIRIRSRRETTFGNDLASYILTLVKTTNPQMLNAELEAEVKTNCDTVTAPLTRKDIAVPARDAIAENILFDTKNSLEYGEELYNCFTQDCLIKAEADGIPVRTESMLRKKIKSNILQLDFHGIERMTALFEDCRRNELEKGLDKETRKVLDYHYMLCQAYFRNLLRYKTAGKTDDPTHPDKIKNLNIADRLMNDCICPLEARELNHLARDASANETEILTKLSEAGEFPYKSKESCFAYFELTSLVLGMRASSLMLQTSPAEAKEYLMGAKRSLYQLNELMSNHTVAVFGEVIPEPSRRYDYNRSLMWLVDLISEIKM